MLSELFARFARKRVASASPAIGSAAPEPVRPGFTFAVDHAEPAKEPLWSESLEDSLSRRFRRKIFVLPGAARTVTNAQAGSFLKFRDILRLKDPDRPLLSKPDSELLRDVCHPFVDAVHRAFSDHRPLRISPDVIWLVIAQGFSHHVNANAETLRPRLVRHQGKRELSATLRDLTIESLEVAIGSFSAKIREETDPVLHETLLCDFSTTTPEIRVASEVALMGTYRSYFTYSMGCVCGIPKITFDGSVVDWQRIRSRVEVLATYDLEWWVSRLRPILDEFVRTASGKPSLNFWQAFYKPRAAYAVTLASGRITDLFPYLGDPPNRVRNGVLPQPREDWALPAKMGVGTRSFPSGISSVPVLFEVNGQDNDLDFVAGFFAVQQEPRDLTLSTLIGWSVVEPHRGRVALRR